MATEPLILSSFSPRACPRCMLTCFSAGDRELSTNQLLFMQNKPNVKYAQINVNSYMKSKYEKLDTWLSGKNKPNSNPNKPNLQKAKMNVNLTLTKDYRKKDDFIVRINKANSNPISVKPKMNVNLYVIEDYENVTALRPKKTNPNKANFFKGQNELKTVCRKIWPHPSTFEILKVLYIIAFGGDNTVRNNNSFSGG